MVEHSRSNTDNSQGNNWQNYDPNLGINNPRSIHELSYTNEQLRNMKQKYLMENIINCGYDATEFGQFMDQKMPGGGGMNVDNWDMEALMNVCTEYQHQKEVASGLLGTDEDQERNGRFLRIENEINPMGRSGSDGPWDEEIDQLGVEAINYDLGNNFRDEKVGMGQELPGIKARQRIASSKITPTKLNHRKVTIKVVSSEIRKGGFFSSDYVLFKITSEPLGWKICRKDEHFYSLRRILKAQFPHILIPPLPLQSKKMTPKFLRKREKQFTRFLQAVSRSEELKSSICLNNFLTIDDQKEFLKATKVFEKTRYGKSLSEIVTAQGEILVERNENAMVFCERMNDFTDSYQILHQEIISTTKEIKQKSADLAETFHQLGEHLDKLSNVNYMIRVDRLHELYAWLSKMSIGTGNHVATLGDAFNLYLGGHLKYHCDENESFREMQATREQARQNFDKKEQKLLAKKDKLFQTQDITKWNFEGPQDEMIRRKDELLRNKSKASRFILTKETQELEHLREAYFFYSNQSLSEVRRVGADNGQLLSDHFVTMSQIQCTYINQHYDMWSDFLNKFSEESSDPSQQPLRNPNLGSNTHKDSMPFQTATSTDNMLNLAMRPSPDDGYDIMQHVDEAKHSRLSDKVNSFNQKRRISNLNDIGSFQASLDAVQVKKARVASTPAAIGSSIAAALDVSQVKYERSASDEYDEQVKDNQELFQNINKRQGSTKNKLETDKLMAASNGLDDDLPFKFALLQAEKAKELRDREMKNVMDVAVKVLVKDELKTKEATEAVTNSMQEMLAKISSPPEETKSPAEQEELGKESNSSSGYGGSNRSDKEDSCSHQNNSQSEDQKIDDEQVDTKIDQDKNDSEEGEQSIIMFVAPHTPTVQKDSIDESEADPTTTAATTITQSIVIPETNTE